MWSSNIKFSLFLCLKKICYDIFAIAWKNNVKESLCNWWCVYNFSTGQQSASKYSACGMHPPKPWSKLLWCWWVAQNCCYDSKSGICCQEYGFPSSATNSSSGWALLNVPNVISVSILVVEFSLRLGFGIADLTLLFSYFMYACISWNKHGWRHVMGVRQSWKDCS